jgi:hypothetical protein
LTTEVRKSDVSSIVFNMAVLLLHVHIISFQGVCATPSICQDDKNFKSCRKCYLSTLLGNSMSQQSLFIWCWNTLILSLKQWLASSCVALQIITRKCSTSEYLLWCFSRVHIWIGTFRSRTHRSNLGPTPSRSYPYSAAMRRSLDWSCVS